MFCRLISLIAMFEIIPGLWSESNGKTDKIYCYDNDTSPYRYFASKTPYDAVKGSGIELLGDECAPVYVWTLMRHPARYGGDECWKSERMESIRDEILNNANIKLCEQDKQLLRRWKFHGENNDHDEVHIATQGITQLKNFAERFRDVFRELFDSRPLDENYFEFITSSKTRCADSCVAFVEQFLHSSTVSLKDTKSATCHHDDSLIRLKSKREKKQLSEVTGFRASDEMKKTIHEISVRLGFEEEDLSYEKVYQMYLNCAFDYSWSDDTKSAFCAAFEPHHLQVFEYLFDIMAYHARGYGNSDNTYLGEQLVVALMNQLSAAAQGNNDDSKSKLASSYFAHSHTIVPFLKQFDLFKDDEPLTKDNFTTMKNRKFRASRFDPFGANIVIALFKCENETKIAFYMNEEPLEIPDFEGNVCTLTQLEEKFRDTLSNSKPKSSEGI